MHGLPAGLGRLGLLGRHHLAAQFRIAPDGAIVGGGQRGLGREMRLRGFHEPDFIREHRLDLGIVRLPAGELFDGFPDARGRERAKLRLQGLDLVCERRERGITVALRLRRNGLG